MRCAVRSCAAQSAWTTHQIVNVGDNVVLRDARVVRVIPPCGAVRQPHVLMFTHVCTEKQRNQTPKREMLQRAVMCAGSEM